MVAVFQWGWGTELLGIDHAVPVSSWVPILMFTILFGLSMDYEVFLLSRVREDYERTGDPRGSVVRGLAATGKVISSAAAIMVAVFLGFATEVDVLVKMLGVGMAVGDPAGRHRRPDGAGAGDDVAARPLELVAAPAGSTGSCRASVPRSPTPTWSCSPALSPAPPSPTRPAGASPPVPSERNDHDAHPDRGRLAHPGPVARSDRGPRGSGRHDDDVPDAPRVPA